MCTGGEVIELSQQVSWRVGEAMCTEVPMKQALWCRLSSCLLPVNCGSVPMGPVFETRAPVKSRGVRHDAQR